MKLSPGATITDEKKFLESHREIVDSSCNDRVKEPYRMRLEQHKNQKGIE